MRLGYPMTLGTGDKTSYPFDEVFDESIRVTSKEIREGAVDALIVWGGEDVSPSLYKHRVSRRTYADARPSRRDLVEMDVVNAAKEMGIPMIGICRGAQLMCALSGGTLIQHVSNHQGGDHGILMSDGGVVYEGSISGTSCHHQMLFPFEVEHKMLGIAENKLSHTYIGQDDNEIEFMHRDSTPEPEVVYFPQTKALCIQGHPEFVSDRNDKFIRMSVDLARKLMNKEL